MTDPTLAATDAIDSDHTAVIEFARRHAAGESDAETAVSLFYAVRDGFRYDPYRIDPTPAGMRASTVLTNGYGWCVPKATLLAASCRAVGIPARLGFADVRNHLSTERMRQVMGTDIFYWHGFTEIRLAQRWVKATPAFNIELCDKFGLLPLDFDGRTDSIYHPFDRQGRQHMEYVRQRGAFDDLPLDRIVADFMTRYPAWRPALELQLGADFLADVDREVRG